MMKSLAVFGFIFLLAASVNAALMISVNGVIEPPLAEIEVQPDETAVIGIHGDGLTPPPIGLYLFVEGPGRIKGHTIVYRGSLSLYEDYSPEDPHIPELPDLVKLYRDLLGMPDLMDLSYITLADGVVPMAPLEGLLVDDIILHCDGLGDVTLSLISDDFATIYDTQDIQQIPEPMTLLLLGVGGLFAVARQGGKQQA
jgi:hypothetical protein